MSKFIDSISFGGHWKRRAATKPLRLTMPANKFEDPQFWRVRAEEVRSVADEMKPGEPRAIMFRIAASYERIAKFVEYQARDKK